MVLNLQIFIYISVRQWAGKNVDRLMGHVVQGLEKDLLLLAPNSLRGWTPTPHPRPKKTCLKKGLGRGAAVWSSRRNLGGPGGFPKHPTDPRTQKDPKRQKQAIVGHSQTVSVF